MGRLRPKVLVLASASPQRHKLLKDVRKSFEIVPSHVDETTAEKNPRKMVIDLAVKKALHIAASRPDAVVLGADTTVVCKGEIIGKPADRADALRILRLLNGSWQDVYTGLAVVKDGRVWKTAVRSKVQMYELSDEELSLLAGKHMDKAGAYAVQDKDDPFVRRIAGERDNVIGLPRKAVRELLKKAGA
jgi:septum formation protein